MEYKKKLSALRRKKKSIDAYTYNAELYKLQLHSPLINKKIDRLKKLYPGLADECYEQEREFATIKRINMIKKTKPVKQVRFMSATPTKGEQKKYSGSHRDKIVPTGDNIFFTKLEKINKHDEQVLNDDYHFSYRAQKELKHGNNPNIYKSSLNGLLPIYVNTIREEPRIYVDKNELLKVFTKPPEYYCEDNPRPDIYYKNQTSRFVRILYSFKHDWEYLPTFYEDILLINGKKRLSIKNAYSELSKLGYGKLKNSEYHNILKGYAKGLGEIYYKVDGDKVIIYSILGNYEDIKYSHDIIPNKASINYNKERYDIVYRFKK